MSKPSLLLHVNGLSQTDADPFATAHIEERVLSRTFVDRGWECHLVDWHDVDADSLVCSKVVHVQSGQTIRNVRMNDIATLVIARSLGSVEAQYDQLSNYFECLESNFLGAVINHPRAIRYGMNKLYLQKLADEKFPVIESLYFPPTVTKEEISDTIPWSAEATVIKPLSGECGNSVARFCDVDENFFRRKESKVRGWVAQPFISGIYSGEISLTFVEYECVGAVRKTPANGEFRVNERWNPTYDLLRPTESHVQVAEAILRSWPFPTYLARVDILLEGDQIFVLEVETVNPGFLYIPAVALNQSVSLAAERLEELAVRLVQPQKLQTEANT